MLTLLWYDLVGGARQLAADISVSAVLQNPPVCGQNSRQNQVSAKRIHTSSLPNTKHRNMSAILLKHNVGNALCSIIKDTVQGQGQELGRHREQTELGQ